MKGVVILGQTSTGKSDFAVQIAKLTQGEVVSADSRQVYKGMNLGSGKITKKEMGGIPHHLLDVVSPKQIFTVNDFQKLANKKIEEILKRGKVPIICGGTGFYIDAIGNGTIFPEVPANKKLRAILEKKTTEELFETLKKLDSARAKTIDKHNKVRLVRAIEIAKALGKNPPLRQDLSGLPKFEFIKIGLTMPKEILMEKVRIRLLTRIKQGMLREIKKLHDRSLPAGRQVSWKRLENFGLEYRYGALYLQGKISKEEMIEQLNTKIWQFAKRQKTWFQRDKNIIWINPTKKSEKTMALKAVKNFLK
jgi:tRNA dimethylallyltransferase